MINDMINAKNFDPRLLEIRKLSFKGVFTVNIYYIKYITTKSFDHVNIGNEDFIYLIFNNITGYIAEKDEIKYLVLTSTDESRWALKNRQNFGKKLNGKLKQCMKANQLEISWKLGKNQMMICLWVKC